MDKLINQIAEELNIKYSQAENTIKLIDEGNTIPFIARYRKEVTGGLSDEILRTFNERLTYLRNIEERKNLGKSFSVVVVAEGAKPKGGDIVVDLNRAPEQNRSGCTGGEHHENPAGGAKLRFFVT